MRRCNPGLLREFHGDVVDAWLWVSIDGQTIDRTIELGGYPTRVAPGDLDEWVGVPADVAVALCARSVWSYQDGDREGRACSISYEVFTSVKELPCPDPGSGIIDSS